MTTAAEKACQCGEPIVEWSWRAPHICLQCYLGWKSGSVIVCSTGDVRVGDCVPGGLVHRTPAIQRNVE